MAYINPSIPLKDLKTGNYFYPLTNLNQIICTNNRLSAFITEDNNNLLNLNNINSISNTNAAAFLQPYWQFRQWSLDNSTGEKTSYYEDYILPITDNNRTTNATYNILTSKNQAAPNKGIINKISFYSTAETISSASRVELLDNYLISSSRNDTTVDIRANGLLIYGQTYGNDAASMVSNTAGVFRFGDGGPQIIFNTSNSSRGLAAQAGALIFTDHDAAATGASFHFVTTESNNNNGGNLTVTAPRFRARVGLTIGQNSDNTSRALYVTGQGQFTGRLYCNEWIEFSGNTGLYFPNSGSGTHLYPANNCTYGSFQMQGTKGGYFGITAGNNNNYMTFMCTAQHQGLYNAANGQWAFYYDKTNKRIGIFTSGTDATYTITLGAPTRILGILSAKYAKDFIHNTNECNFIPDAYSNSFWFNYDTVTRKNNGNISEYLMGNGKHGYANLRANKVYNAVWNDFAEYREGDITEPGRVVAVTQQSNKVNKTTIRLQPCAHIISDTFGCSVGQSDTAKTPVGVAGRVLVYPYQDISNYKIGDCLCAAPNGTADIMSREEIIYYPDRIIGIVDEIPTYEYWNQTLTTNKEGDVEYKIQTKIKVNGRIWVYVR